MLILTSIIIVILIYYIWKTDKLDSRLKKAKMYCYECNKRLKTQVLSRKRKNI